MDLKQGAVLAVPVSGEPAKTIWIVMDCVCFFFYPHQVTTQQEKGFGLCRSKNI